MLFHKSLVSSVAAITLATMVAAAATPPLTGSGSGSPNQPEGYTQGSSPSQGSGQGSSPSQGSSQVPTCSPDLNPMCCETSIPFPNLSDSVKASLQTLDPNLNQNLNAGQNCAPPGAQGWYCVL